MEHPMPEQNPIHDYLRPRVTALVRDAVAQGMAQDAVVAVLIDIFTSPGFDTAAPDPTADTDIRPDWQRHPDVVLVTDSVIANVPTVGVQAEDDFIAPLTMHD